MVDLIVVGRALLKDPERAKGASEPLRTSVGYGEHTTKLI